MSLLFTGQDSAPVASPPLVVGQSRPTKLNLGTGEHQNLTGECWVPRVFHKGFKPKSLLLYINKFIVTHGWL